ncbi:uncharacterized protein LOC117653641 [Thrips palmi]|uniref:Uncharacterized protein LOC117653641 n=1 Tax=Thrips palmi TaxID=161013 RepID=A0A6P9AIT2_THRPL|nr:uncharacterized protein LOC117653641 [Thrips palmi]
MLAEANTEPEAEGVPEAKAQLEDEEPPEAKYKRKEYFLYLRGSATTAYQRIQQRARDEENTLSKDYIQQLHLILDNWMENEPGLHAVVDATGSPETVQQQVIEALGRRVNGLIPFGAEVAQLFNEDKQITMQLLRAELREAFTATL